MLEPKDPSTLTQMLADINAAKCENSILIETSTLTVAQQAVAAGFPVWFFWGTTITSPTVQSVIDAGVNYLAVAHGVSRPTSRRW